MRDFEMPWKPFGLTLTYGEWEDILTWYVQKNIAEILDNKEGNENAFKLYSEKLNNGADKGPKNS